MAKMWTKISVCLGILATIGFILGQFLPYWRSRANRYKYDGLWESCFRLAVTGERHCTSWKDVEGWLNAVRALEVIADIFAVATVVMLVVYIRKLSGPSSLKLIRAAFLACILTAVCSLIGIIIYAAKYDSSYKNSMKLDWSFGLTTAAGVLYAVIGVLLLIDVRSSRMAGNYISI